MDVLVVGAGATGQVLGVYLQRGGAKVSFFVRPKYADAVRAGLKVEEKGGARRVMPLRPDGVLTSAAEAQETRWDAVFVCLSSTALRAGTWLEELAAAVGDTTFVCIQPGLDDRTFVESKAPKARVLWAMFPLIAYEVGTVEPGDSTAVAVWRPPLTKLPIAGDKAIVRPLVDALSRGGLPARAVADVSRDLAYSGAVLNLHIVALECAGWSFTALRQDGPLLDEMHAAIQEALALSAHRLGGRPPLPLRLLRPWISRLVLRAAPRVIPLPAETYFRVHFTKVGDQTTEQLAAYALACEAAGLPATALSALGARHAKAHAAAPARKSA
jgi:2-dehydropantoate 2-reductase